MLKIEITELSQQYSRHKNSKKRSQNILDRQLLNLLEEELASNPENGTIIEQIEKVKSKVEISMMEETKAAQIRSGIKWREEGEKCSKFFLSLEKSRASDNTITKISTDGKTTYKELEILNVIGNYYEQLYKQQNNNSKEEKTTTYLENLKIPKIPETDKEECDRPLSEKDIAEAIKLMKNGSSPGNDGLPIEFYKIFWKDIKDALLKSFSYSFKSKQLSFSQQKGIISLLHKGKGLDESDLGNWRPITLSNADYKILAKALSIRLSRTIPNIISNDQKGFIKGRNISEIIREIDDIVEHEKLNESQSILFVIDYTKAFDTVSNSFILKCLDHFGFGTYFKTWIETILSNRTFCVKNGGYISKEYNMERGVRQGCPISPILFLLAVEMLSIKVKQCKTIKGIQRSHNDTPHKLKQFADDTTFLLKDLIDFREILSKIKLFSDISGLMVNMTKSFAMWLGKNAVADEEHYGIKFVNSIKVLGIYFSNECAASENPKNWERKIEKLEKMFGLWSKRNLSIKGKIIIIKTFGLSQFVYVLQSIGLPDEVLTKINRMFFSFLWKRTYSNKKAIEKVKRKTMYSSYCTGGMNMINIELMQKSFLIDWARKLLLPADDGWKSAPVSFLRGVGGKKIFNSIINKNELIGLENIKNKFWKKVVQTWCENNKNLETKTEEINVSDPIFNNNRVKYNSKILFLPESIKRGIYYVGDVTTNGRIISYAEFEEKIGQNARSFLDYTLIKGSLENKTITYDNNSRIRELFCGKNIEKIKRKDIYNLIKEEELPNHIINFWARKQVSLEEKHWTLPLKCTKETRLHTLQWKILHNIFPTAVLLKKMGIVNSANCDKCSVTEYTDHFFFTCIENKVLWNEVTSIINSKFGIYIKPNMQNVMTGYFNKKLSPQDNKEINHIYLISKMVISKVKYGKRRNMVDLLHQELKERNITTQ